MTLVDAVAIALFCMAPFVFSALWGWMTMRAMYRLGVVRRLDG